MVKDKNERIKELVELLRQDHPGIGTKVKVVLAGHDLMRDMLETLEIKKVDKDKESDYNDKVSRANDRAKLYEQLTKVSSQTDEVMKTIENLSDEDISAEEKIDEHHEAGQVVSRVIKQKNKDKNVKTNEGSDTSNLQERGD